MIEIADKIQSLANFAILITNLKQNKTLYFKEANREFDKMRDRWLTCVIWLKILLILAITLAAEELSE